VVGVNVEREPPYFSAQIASARRFFLDLAPAAGVRLAVVSGGWEHCLPDYVVERPTFPFWGIEYVARGRGKLWLRGRKWEIGPGIAFAYGPGISQRIEADPADPPVKYFVDFAGRGAGRLLREHAPSPGGAIQSAVPSEILEIFDMLIRDASRSTPLAPRLAALHLEALVLKLAETAIAPGAAATAAFATYRRCVERMEARWAALGSLAEIAAECHVDPAYLCRLFQRFDRQSPYQRLLRLKMAGAANRLREPGVTVKEVAAAVGFDDPFHFSRVFKQVLGVSPSRLGRHPHPSRPGGSRRGKRSSR
jgi:AraC-like DNA-binding protein